MASQESDIQAQADVVPAISNDVFSGYKLKTVRSGTAVHQLGFRSGDPDAVRDRAGGVDFVKIDVLCFSTEWMLRPSDCAIAALAASSSEYAGGKSR